MTHLLQVNINVRNYERLLKTIPDLPIISKYKSITLTAPENPDIVIYNIDQDTISLLRAGQEYIIRLNHTKLSAETIIYQDNYMLLQGYYLYDNNIIKHCYNHDYINAMLELMLADTTASGYQITGYTKGESP